MAVALRAAGAVTENTASPSLPGGTTAGDLILVIVHSATVATAAASGYTQLGTYLDGGGNSQTTVLYRVATGSDSITLTGLTSYVTYVSAYTGVDSAAFVSAATANAAGTFTCPSVTATRAGSYLVCSLATETYGGVGPITWTPPGGMTERVDYSGTRSTFPYANTAADLSGVGAGATGAKTFTPSNTSIGSLAGVSVLLQPPTSGSYLPALML